MTVSQPDLERHLQQLRSSVADPRAGIYGPGSASWAIGREAAIFLGGGRAALLQLAHPFVAHGVDQHSATRTDPLGRFIRTFENVFDMVFGDLDAAIASARRVHGVHRRVTGVIHERAGDLAAGSRYQANDEGALIWVYATLIDTAVMVHDLVVRPLSPGEKDAYYQESKRFARLFGIEGQLLPADYPAFERYSRQMWESDRLTVTGPALATARFLLRSPHPVAGPFWRWYVLMTAGLMPPRLRAEYELEYGASDQVVFDASIRVLRTVHPFLPRRLRWMPAYLSAERRLRGHEGRDWLDRLTRGATRRGTRRERARDVGSIA
jgi:uncharacterized protein (DUF2236 family)